MDHSPKYVLEETAYMIVRVGAIISVVEGDIPYLVSVVWMIIAE